MCREGEHSLQVVFASSAGYGSEHTVRWCSVCGAVAVDTDYDGRTNPGAIMEMRFPMIAQYRSDIANLGEIKQMREALLNLYNEFQRRVPSGCYDVIAEVRAALRINVESDWAAQQGAPPDRKKRHSS